MVITFLLPLAIGGVFICLTWLSHAHYVRTLSGSRGKTQRSLFLLTSTFARYGLLCAGVFWLHRAGWYQPLESSLALFIGMVATGYICYRSDICT